MEACEGDVADIAMAEDATPVAVEGTAVELEKDWGGREVVG